MMKYCKYPLTFFCALTASASLLLLLAPGAADAASAGCLNAPVINGSVTQPHVPGDSQVLSQAGFNCFGWSEFLALNWPAAAPGEPAESSFQRFGEPGDTSPTVWETFMNVHGVMRPGAAPPIPWGASADVPAACRPHAEKHDGPIRALRRTTKFSIDFDATADVQEAHPHGNPNWLADRDGNLVFYEILMNRAEYHYFVDNQFYDADKQYQAVTNGQHIDFPQGVVGREPGAIEIKAAWLSVPADEADDPKWVKNYKLSEALVYDPHNPDFCEHRTVALVGLHILHKTTTQPQWTWATFEHVNNTPDQAEVDRGNVPKDKYRFFNPDFVEEAVSPECQTYKTDTCQPLGGNTKTHKAPNTPPPYCLKLAKERPDDFTCLPKPVQVTRVHPIPDTLINPAVSLNKWVHEQIAAQNKHSVFLNYELVSVLWSDSAVDENQPGEAVPTVPLSLSGLRPTVADLPLANTMMETYVQEKTCQDCHSNAAIAESAFDQSPTQGGDYSFIVKMAQSSSTSATEKQ